MRVRIKVQYIIFSVLIVLIFLITSCSTFTSTPVPFSEIDLESLLVLSGDLPAGLTGAQVRDQVPEMFKDIGGYDNAIFREFERNGKHIGGVTIFLYESLDALDVAYDSIGDFGESGGKEIKNTGGEMKITVGNIPDVGEEAKYWVVEGSFLGISLDGADLAFTRCHSVVHIRVDTANIDVIVAYAKRLDKRITELVCR